MISFVTWWELEIEMPFSRFFPTLNSFVTCKNNPNTDTMYVLVLAEACGQFSYIITMQKSHDYHKRINTIE